MLTGHEKVLYVYFKHYRIRGTVGARQEVSKLGRVFEEVGVSGERPTKLIRNDTHGRGKRVIVTAMKRARDYLAWLFVRLHSKIHHRQKPP